MGSTMKERSGLDDRVYRPKRRAMGRTKSRDNATERERTRMNTIISAFDHLRQLVPTSSSDRKLSMIETLQLATLYIQDLAKLVNDDIQGPGYTTPMKTEYSSPQNYCYQQSVRKCQSEWRHDACLLWPDIHALNSPHYWIVVNLNVFLRHRIKDARCTTYIWSVTTFHISLIIFYLKYSKIIYSNWLLFHSYKNGLLMNDILDQSGLYIQTSLWSINLSLMKSINFTVKAG